MSGPWSEAKRAIARLVAPLAIWMTAGWAAYPYAMEYIANRTDEAVNLAEIRSFSIAAATACIVVAAISGVYHASTRSQDSDDQPPQKRCPFCGEDNPSSSATCALCDRPMGR